MKKSITRLSVYFAVLGAVFLITVITVSASEVKTPVWVSAGTDERYPQVRYLSAVGMGSSRESAISDAKKQLAGIFSSKVEATLQSSSQSETTETISGQMTGSDQTNTQSSTKVTVDVVLKGVEVRETYEEPKNKIFYAFAVLDKLKAKVRYLNELNLKKVEIQRNYQLFSENPKLSLGIQIDQGLKEFKQLKAEALVLSNVLALTEPLTTVEYLEFQKRMASLSGEVLVYFGIKNLNPEFGNYFQNLRNCLTKKNIQLLTEPEMKDKARIFILSEIVEKRSHLNINGWVKYRYEANSQVQSGQRLLGEAVAHTEEAGRTQELCRERGVITLSQQVCEEISQLVLENL